MVECQLMPSGVSDEALLNAYKTVPREKFLPEGKKDIAYIDEDIFIEEDRFLLEPATHAKMVQALNLGEDEAVLDVACDTGYSSAILSHLAKTVVALTQDKSISDIAGKNCEELNIYNVAFFAGDFMDCCPQYAPYSAIIFNGAVEKLPASVFKRLAVGGRLIYIKRDRNDHMGAVILVHKLAENKFSELNLFHAATPYLPGFEPQEEFIL